MLAVFDQQAQGGWNVTLDFVALFVRHEHLLGLDPDTAAMLGVDCGFAQAGQHFTSFNLVFFLDLDLPFFRNIVGI